MRLLDTIRRRDALSSDMVALVQSYQSATSVEPILPSFKSYAANGYHGNGIVFSLILARLMLFSEAEFKFRDLATKRLFGSPDLALLERPWPGGTTGELLARMEQDASLAGNAFIRRGTDAAGQDRLFRLRPDHTEIVSGLIDGDPSAREVVGYMYHPLGYPSQESEFYPVSEVAHYSPIPDPLADWRGMSWITPVVRDINADKSMTAHKSAFFENAATPNLLIKYAQKLSTESKSAVREAWQARFGGPDNAWKTAVLDEGADVQVIGSSFEQSRLVDVQAAGENRIAAAAGVPGIVVGLKEGLAAATYSNYAQAMRRFADLTMRPLWRSAAASLEKLVEVPPNARLWYDTTDIAALREGERERAETAQILALAAGELIRSGYTPETVATALIAGDFSLLAHTGAIPTALYPGGNPNG